MFKGISGPDSDSKLAPNIIDKYKRKLGLCAGKEFVLRLPLPVGKLALQEVISMFAGTGRVGKETIVKRGKLLMGTRVL